MSYHKDDEVNEAIIRLLDALCSWERGTGRRSTLILIPHAADEKIVKAEDGKPVNNENLTVGSLISWALKQRGEDERETNDAKKT